MTTVKIIPAKGETIEEAEEKLYKALHAQREGDLLHRESFDDPAMADLNQRVIKEHVDMYEELIREVMEILDGEYSDNF